MALPHAKQILRRGFLEDNDPEVGTNRGAYRFVSAAATAATAAHSAATSAWKSGASFSAARPAIAAARWISFTRIFIAVLNRGGWCLRLHVGRLRAGHARPRPLSNVSTYRPTRTKLRLSCDRYFHWDSSGLTSRKKRPIPTTALRYIPAIPPLFFFFLSCISVAMHCGMRRAQYSDSSNPEHQRNKRWVTIVGQIYY